jgi:hypothetical protein
LTEEQLEMANPPVNVNYPRIQEEYSYLQNDALPNRMTVIPFTTIDTDGEGVNMYSTACSNQRRGPQGQPSERNYTNIISMLNEFIDKFGDYVNKFKKRDSYNYTVYDVREFCDSYIASYTDKREMAELRNTGVNMEELYEICLRAADYSFRDQYTITKDYSLMYGSSLMKLVVNNIKKRVDEERNGTSSNNPKMMIVSGHDNTLIIQELFLINSLGLSMDDYRETTFASQIALEITRNDDDKKNRTYSDYFVNYYFNDDKIFRMPLNEFLDKVEQNFHSEEEIYAYCNPKKSSNNTNNTDSNNNDNHNNDTSNNGTNNNNGNETNNAQDNESDDTSIHSYFSTKKRKNYKTALIVFICLFAVSLLVNIIFAICLLRKRNIIPEQIQASSMNNIKV